jgi:hypothetical protein
MCAFEYACVKERKKERETERENEMFAKVFESFVYQGKRKMGPFNSMEKECVTKSFATRGQIV